MSKDVIIQFSWSGKPTNTSAFKELKNVQIVLLSAMVRVDAGYTLHQFENDIKSVLRKCVQTSNKHQVSIDVYTVHT